MDRFSFLEKHIAIELLSGQMVTNVGQHELTFSKGMKALRQHSGSDRGYYFQL